ncbi:MAG: glycosyltransferase family 1 protein [Saprospiraceae bacterium]
MDSKNSLKIGFDAKRLFLNYSGLGNYSRTLVKNLKTHFPEHEYHLFTPEIRDSEETQFFLQGGFHIHTAEGWPSSALWRTVGLAREVKKLKLDIYHGLSHEIPFGLPANTRTVVTMHDLIYEVYPHFFKWYDRSLYSIKYKSACRRADAIIAISEATRNDLIARYKIEDHKIKVIYQSCADLFQNNVLTEKTKRHFLYVGNIEPRKGLLDIVHAYAMLPVKAQLPFVVVGGVSSYMSEVQKAIRYYGLESHFEFKGKMANTDLLTLYDGALTLMLPSVYEGFGIPLVESLFRGVPVITSPYSALPEAAGPGAIKVNPADHIALSKAMEAMTNAGMWKALSDAGRDYVKQKFSSRVTAEELHKFYLTLL